MAEYGYYKRKRGLFSPDAKTPFKLSRSKIDLFFECPRCFYLDRRHGVPRPSFPAFTLNSAVDNLLKNEFDMYRAKHEPHPLMAEHNLDLVPFQHSNLEEWRHNFTGVQFIHELTNFLVFGAVDDIWVSPQDELFVVDYKATSKEEDPTIDGFWQQAYKRQMEIYQWLLRGNGFRVSDTGYFVYVNGKKNQDTFDAKLEFDIHLIPYTGNGSWIEQTLLDAKACLMADAIPDVGENCEYCPYRQYAGETIREVYKARTTDGGTSEKKPTEKTNSKASSDTLQHKLF